MLNFEILRLSWLSIVDVAEDVGALEIGDSATNNVPWPRIAEY